LIRPAHKGLGGAIVVAWETIQGTPGHGVPTRFVGTVPHHGFVNEASRQQLALGSRDYVRALPSSFCQVGGGGQQPTVVVADELPGDLQQQRARRMA